MLTTEEVIKRFQEVQGTKYDYSKFAYNGMHKSGTILYRL